MDKVRLRYSKTGRAKYISHLDLSATMRRAMLRAGVALKYSEGFNPHPYISVALPLSVGVESKCELMDFRIDNPTRTDGLPALINASLPDGLRIDEAYASGRKFNDIEWIELTGKLYFDTMYHSDMIKELQQKFAAHEIVIPKKTKRGVSEIDIAPHIKNLEVYEGEAIIIRSKVSAQEPSIGPEDILNAIKSWDIGAQPDHTAFMRMELYDRDMKVFR